MNPRILGTAGGGLTGATWAANADVARIGQRGEERTAEILNKYAEPVDGVTVLHDVRIPIPNFTANIDHVVIAGRTVHLIDAKVWKPARYWTFRGTTRRGLEKFAPADKKTMVMAREAIDRFLAKEGLTGYTFAPPLLAVWPSSTRAELKLGWLKVPGAHALTSEAFRRHAKKEFAVPRRRGIGIAKTRSADPHLVVAIASLINAPPPNRQFRAG